MKDAQVSLNIEVGWVKKYSTQRLILESKKILSMFKLLLTQSHQLC